MGNPQWVREQIKVDWTFFINITLKQRQQFCTTLYFYMCRFEWPEVYIIRLLLIMFLRLGFSFFVPFRILDCDFNTILSNFLIFWWIKYLLSKRGNVLVIDFDTHTFMSLLQNSNKLLTDSSCFTVSSDPQRFRSKLKLYA